MPDLPDVREAPNLALRIFREATKLDPTGFRVGFGTRCAIGVALPLAAGLLANERLYGVAAAIGALPVGFASLQGVYRTRAAAALMTAAGVALSAFVGALCGGSTVASVVAAAATAFAYGVLASLGPAATAVGVNSVVTLAIFGQFHDTPAQAATAAAFVFAGGLLQTLLLVSVWPLARFEKERRVLGAAYGTLAEYAGHFPAARLRAPDTTAFATLSATLADPQPFSARGDIAAFEALLTEAERLRATLGALASDRYLLDSTGNAAAASAIVALGSAASTVLREIARALEEARAPDAGDDVWERFDAPIGTLEIERSHATAKRALGDAEALLGQLRAAWRTASAPASDLAEEPPPGRRAPRVLRASAIPEALTTLRANLTFRSGFAQHGIRLAVVLALATLAAHTLPLQRPYWIALTAALVLRNDFATTFTRGTARILGTLAGALVASTIASLVHPYPLSLLVSAVLFAWLAFAIFGVNYALFTLAITGYVVFLLALGGLSEHIVLIDRVGETLLGGALALAAYALWPTWERTLVPDRLAELLESQRRYTSLVLRAYVDPEGAGEATIRAAQSDSWLARSNAETSVDRMLAEPVRPRAVTVRAALGILAASRRFGIAALSLQSRLARARPVATSKLAILTDEIDASFAILAEALRKHADPEPLPGLRDAQIALAKRLDASADGDPASLAAETDLMVDSLNSMAHVLHRLRTGEDA